jgi:hypothetical protein
MSMSILLSLAAALPANDAGSDRNSWCFSPLAPRSENMRRVEDIEASIPGEAERRRLPSLERRSVARLGARRARSSQYYVRAGISAAPNLTPEQVYAQARRLNFEFHYDEATGNILVSSFNTLHGRPTRYDVVIRVRTGRPIRRSFVACYGSS